MAATGNKFGVLDQLSDYLEKIKVAGVNAGELLVGFFSGLGGASIIHGVLSYAAPAFATGPVGGALTLLGGAWLGTEIAQAAKVDLAQKDPYKYLAASAVAMLLATMFLPQAVFTFTGASTAQALQAVTLLVHP